MIKIQNYQLNSDKNKYEQRTTDIKRIKIFQQEYIDSQGTSQWFMPEYYRLVVNGELKYAKGRILFKDFDPYGTHIFAYDESGNYQFDLKHKSTFESGGTRFSVDIPYPEIYVFYEDGFYIKKYKNDDDDTDQYIKIDKTNLTSSLTGVHLNQMKHKGATFLGWYYHINNDYSKSVRIDNMDELCKKTSIFRFKEDEGCKESNIHIPKIPTITLVGHWKINTYEVKVKNLNTSAGKSSFKYSKNNKEKVKTVTGTSETVVMTVPYNTNIGPMFFRCISERPKFVHSNLKYLNKVQRDRINAAGGYFLGWSTTPKVKDADELVLRGYLNAARGDTDRYFTIREDTILYPQFETLIIYPACTFSYYKLTDKWEKYTWITAQYENPDGSITTEYSWDYRWIQKKAEKYTQCWKSVFEHKSQASGIKFELNWTGVPSIWDWDEKNNTIIYGRYVPEWMSYRGQSWDDDDNFFLSNVYVKTAQIDSYTEHFLAGEEGSAETRISYYGLWENGVKKIQFPLVKGSNKFIKNIPIETFNNLYYD